MEKANLLIQNVQVYNSYFKKFIGADVSVLDGKILYIDQKQSGNVKGQQVIDATGMYMVPGLIDIHMHIESSMLTPMAFCRQLASCGVTTIVSEPHEMANVNGMQGVLDMIQAGEKSPIDVFYGIPSCVPSTSSLLETTGGTITAEEMGQLKKNPSVVCVGEVMNYRTIIRENELEITKFLHKLRKEDSAFPIEGHCPALLDLELAKFLYLGINGDHTEHSIEELEQRFSNGMFMEIQEKMLRPEIIAYIAEHNLYEHFCFVTDDVMADTLCSQGHLDALVRKAMKLGMSPEQTIYNASYTPSRRMNLLDRGTIAPGKLADFLLLDNLDTFSIAATYKRGTCIFDRSEKKAKQHNDMCFPESYYHSIKLMPQEQSRFEIPMDAQLSTVKIRVMEIKDGSTKTKEKIVEMPVKDGILQWENSGCMLAVVLERYGKNGEAGYGFLTGDCHTQGAVATSYAHDCHNVLVAGTNPADLQLALNRVIEMQGGMTVVDEGFIKAELPLTIGGILSEKSAGEVGEQLAKVREAMINQGYRHYNPIMSFCTVTLPASPALKLTDKGLIDVTQCKIVPLNAEI